MDVVGVAGDDHPFEKLMRVLVDDLLVFESAGFRFVRVADEIDGLGVLGRVDEAPLDAAREARAAASAQSGGLDLGNDVWPFHGEGLLQVLITVMAQVTIDVDGVAGLVDVLEDEAAFSDGHKNKNF